MDATDRVNELLVETLREALVVPGEHRLYRAGKLAGLFPGRAASCILAAERALQEGLLRRVRLETRGKTETDWVEITPRGVEFLHEQESPVQALHQMRDALRANRQAIPLWLDAMRASLHELEERLSSDAGNWLERLAAMEERIGETLRRLESAGPLVPAEVLESHPWTVDALNYLDRRRGAGATRPCPLPELFAAVAEHHPGLTLSGFGEGMRRLHQRRAVRLLPPENPAQMTQAEFALWDAGAVFYLVAR